MFGPICSLRLQALMLLQVRLGLWRGAGSVVDRAERVPVKAEEGEISPEGLRDVLRHLLSSTGTVDDIRRSSLLGSLRSTCR